MTTAVPRDFAAIALTYALDIVEGRIPACKWTVAACLRQLDDLARQATDEFPYRYEPARGVKVCRTLEMMPHIKGRWATKLITLEPWQIFSQMTLFSWVRVGEGDGLRRFRTDYEEVPRKNAKSTISAGRGLYMLAADGEIGPECYSAATTRDQAKIVWNIAKAMAKKSPGYCTRFGVEVSAHSIAIIDEEAFFKALSADDDTLDGLNPHFASVDELHAHKTRGVWDVVETATGARDQSLLSSITTAGSNRAGICYEVRTYLTQILNAVLARHPDVCARRGYKLEGPKADDESFYGIIYTIDDDDDWTDPEVWAKANPNLGVSVKLDDIARLCRKAIQTPSAQPNFKTKRLNVWINADSAWMDMLKWDACADHKLSIDDFAGEPCFAGIDLATVDDIAPIVYLFQRSIDEPNKEGAMEPRTHYYAFTRCFLPEDTIEDSDNSQYPGWAETGRLITTDGNITDQNAMQDELREAKGVYEFRELAYDPFQASKFASELIGEGFPMVEFGATVKNFSAPMKEVEKAVRSGRFHHDGDPVFAWMISNVVAHVDKKDNVFPNKQNAKQKIDAAVALIMAFGRAMHAPPPERSIYETRGITYL